MKKNKKIFIICGIIVILIIIVLILFLFFNNNKDNSSSKKENVTNENEDCDSITGGSFSLIFKTNGGENIQSLKVCIACSPDSYESIPIPKRYGYTFEGWYIDDAFSTKFSGSTTAEVKPISKLDDKNCIIGYKDIYLYAKWIDENGKATISEDKNDTSENKDNNKSNKNNN